MADHQSQQPITVKDAGSKGGKKTAERYGTDFYKTIGKKGGNRTSELVRLGRKAEDAQTAL